LPKQNRPVVRDGRLQAAKKRTDRSYLRPNGATAPGAPSPAAPEAEPAAPPVVAEPAGIEEELAPVEAVAEPIAPAPAAPAEPRVAAQTRATGAARAIQQQGVRKRREFDVEALGVRDTRYAIHEMRRIIILTVLVVVTLIVLAVVLR
jgi:hypothetical protein